MATERVKFASNYDHVWPNRAQTAFKAGFEGPVKAEVAERARAVGALDEGDGALPRTRDELTELAESEGVDVSAIVGTGTRGQVVNSDIAQAIADNRAGTTGEIHHDESKPGAVIGSGGPSGAEAPTE